VNSALRDLLYLPLGFIPSIFFVSRLVLQWYQSEKIKKSYVSPQFWQLSLFGNLTLFLHHFVQVQYPFALFQALNALVAWRNLNLMRSKKPYSTKTVLLIALFVGLAVTLSFLSQSYFFIGELDWIRTPTKPWDTMRQHHSMGWHLFGTVGACVFASRFWVQWWIAETRKHSELDKTFWCLSILGSIMMVIYSLRVNDVVILFYYCFALVPYMRNLILIRNHLRVEQE